MKLHPIILSGGSGTRLWPLSREHYPKQLLSLTGEHSLLQETLLRLPGLPEMEPPLLVCNEEHRFLVAEQARQIDTALVGIVLEPFGRNTAPALTLAALALHAKCRDGVMLVMPADHVIADNPEFQQVIARGRAWAERGKLVTFGIPPLSPETGYGYIKRGASLEDKAWCVQAFVEKPDLVTAQQYLHSGEYLWNSGMFMLRASVWLSAVAHFAPKIFEACQLAFKEGEQDLDFFRVNAGAFKVCPSDSIDYAVMEKIAQDEGDGRYELVVIPLEAGWSDVGAWSALWDINEGDHNGNVLRGDVYAHASRNSLMLAEHRLVAGIGLEDIIVVETADAVLVAHKSNAQDVKKIVETIKAENRTEHQFHRRVHRPWGAYEGIDKGERFQVKRITVKPGARLSLQMHHHRAEHWVVVRGTARVTRGEEVFLLSENQSTYIPIGVMHRLENPGTLPLEMIEVQSGSYLGEDDIVRLEDSYGRNKGHGQ